MKILIVEDEKELASIIDMSLCSENEVTCFFATTVDEAIQQFNEIHPDLILLDYWLADGFADAFIYHVRKSPRNSRIILISAVNALSGIANKFHIEDFLSKPFNYEDLENLIFNVK